MTTRVELFNEIAGLIFAQLYDAFPIAIDLDEAAIGRALNVHVDEQDHGGARPIVNFGSLPNGEPFRPILYATGRWLRDEGYIRTSGSGNLSNIVLTTKALAVLQATPEVVGGDTLGRKLTKAAGNVGTEAGKAALSEMVGQLIGGVAKAIVS